MWVTVFRGTCQTCGIPKLRYLSFCRFGVVLLESFLIRTPGNPDAVKHSENHDMSIDHLLYVTGGDGREETERWPVPERKRVWG